MQGGILYSMQTTSSSLWGTSSGVPSREGTVPGRRPEPGRSPHRHGSRRFRACWRRKEDSGLGFRQPPGEINHVVRRFLEWDTTPSAINPPVSSNRTGIGLQRLRRIPARRDPSVGAGQRVGRRNDGPGSGDRGGGGCIGRIGWSGRCRSRWVGSELRLGCGRGVPWASDATAGTTGELPGTLRWTSQATGPRRPLRGPQEMAGRFMKEMGLGRAMQVGWERVHPGWGREAGSCSGPALASMRPFHGHGLTMGLPGAASAWRFPA